MGKTLMIVGAVLVVAGFLLLVIGKIPGVGRLPGDIFVKKENVTFYFPLTTSIVISVILSLILMLWNKR